MHYFLVLLYGGPDTVMPIASTLAAVVGVLLLLWQRIVHSIRTLLHSFHATTPKLQNPPPPGSDSTDHGS
jgi:hypothetical protein